MPDPVVAVLATLNSKADEARHLCAELRSNGAVPWLVDLSLRPHARDMADVPGGDVAVAAGSSWDELAGDDRGEASRVMGKGAIHIVRGRYDRGGLSGAIGIGGANGTAMACTVMRALPPLFPKAMISAVAATGAVQWYVAESDIAMFPTIGDTSLNRVTRAVIANAAAAIAAMARGYSQRDAGRSGEPPLVGVSSFGGTQGCVDRVTERLAQGGFEVIHFHASGPGGKALEALARLGELAGVIDLTTHELTDLVVGGVYSAGDGRLTAAGEKGLPQVVVPGAMDHANFWVGQVPDSYRDREFFRYNAQNLLMRTNAEEFRALGALTAERLNAARGPVAVLIPKRGYSEHTKRRAHDVNGKETGPWAQPEVDAEFGRALRADLKRGTVEELDLHINDPAFADACADAFFAMVAQKTHA